MFTRFFVSLMAITLSVGLLTACDSSQENAKKKEPKTEENVAKFSLDASTQANPSTPPALTPKEVAAKIAALPDTIATIGTRSLPKKRLAEGLRLLAKNIQNQGGSLSEALFTRYRNGMAKSLINSTLLLDEAERQKIAVTDKQVEEEFAKLKKRFPNEEIFKEQLKARNATEADLKKDLKDSLRIKALVDREIINNVTVEKNVIKDYYDLHQTEFMTPEQRRASHILLRVTKNDPAEKKKSAEEKLAAIRTRITNGEDFAAVAKKESEDPGSAVKGGDLGFFRRGMMVPPFEKAAFSMKPGDLSEIVKTDFGYHLILLTGEKKAGTLSFDEAKERIGAKLRSEKIRSGVESYIEALRKKTTVTNHITAAP